MNRKIRAYIDLLRLQFFFAWPLLFSSGYLLATSVYGGFSWPALIQVALIGFFGFEAGFVLNDYVDRNYDKFDIEQDRLTKYWRVFGSRPVSEGLISPRDALVLFLLLVAITTGLIVTLPYPNSLFVLGIMLVCYVLEVFYQVKKRKERMPVAQLAGRIDFALFPVAGYLCAGSPDSTALMYFAFFYPFAIAHLGANDLIDVNNDRARRMNTITTMYGESGTAYWIAGFSVANIIMGFLFMTQLGWIARVGIVLGMGLLTVANIAILKYQTPDACLKVLPLFHVTMLIYAGSIALNSVL
ncbi:MAG: UbiA family prenyltransferase [Methanoregulaceae archaeon]|jgi:4-hydroxybenzoate polyprenyltransferase|nr:UbiA family prenyltransferase [Methanoregulaceae archaeon]